MAEEAVVETTEGGGIALKVRLVLGGLAAVALALFVIQNTDDAKVQFLWMEGAIPLFLLLLITSALTLVLAVVLTWFLRRRS